MTSDFDHIDKLEFESPDELLCMAAEIERNAATQYRHLATEMKRYGNAKAAQIFTDLAEEEEAHAAAVEYFQGSTKPRYTENASTIAGEADIIKEWEEEGHSPYSLTPTEAFDLAVRNEERAFSFFVYIAANSTDNAVRETAERLAAEELQHLALVRLERRRMRRVEMKKTHDTQSPGSNDQDSLQQEVAHSAFTLQLAARANQAFELQELLSPIATDPGTANRNNGETLLQALHDHLIAVDRYCDFLISNITGDRPTNDVDFWLNHLSALHRHSGLLQQN